MVTQFALFEFVLFEFVLTQFVLTKFVLTQFVPTEFVLTEFILTEFKGKHSKFCLRSWETQYLCDWEIFVRGVISVECGLQYDCYNIRSSHNCISCYIYKAESR